MKVSHLFNTDTMDTTVRRIMNILCITIMRVLHSLVVQMGYDMRLVKVRSGEFNGLSRIILLLQYSMFVVKRQGYRVCTKFRGNIGDVITSDPQPCFSFVTRLVSIYRFIQFNFIQICVFFYLLTEKRRI